MMSPANPMEPDNTAPTDVSVGCRSWVYRWLTTLTLVGVALGVLTGILCSFLGASPETVDVIRFPGQLFIRALKAFVVPMVFSSMVANTAVLGRTGAGSKMARLVVAYYLATTAVAGLEGVALFNIFSSLFTPLNAADMHAAAKVDTAATEKLTLLDTTLSFGRDLVPDNIFNALLKNQLIGVMTFAIFFGHTLSHIPKGKLVIDFFDACFEALIGMIEKVIIFTPLGVGSLVAGSIAKAQGLASVMQNLGALFAIVMVGQAIHTFIFYPTLYACFTRKNPMRYFLGLPRAWMTAFGTSSSAATLSTTCKCCEDLGVSKKVIEFACPIGCTVNMDGSALERPMVVFWIAHVAGQPIPGGTQAVVAMTSMMLSIGGSPIPSAGVSTLVLMVEAARINFTPEVETLIAFCLAIEWLLDSVRTCVNVSGDAFGAAIIDHCVREDLGASKPGDAEQQQDQC